MSKLVSNILLIVGIVAAFPLGIYYLFAMSGSNPQPAVAMLISHVVFVVCSFLSRNKPRLLIGTVVGLIAFLVSYQADKKFWSDHNQNLCQELRSDPQCMESPTGFSCNESKKLGNFTTGIGVCR